MRRSSREENPEKTIEHPLIHEKDSTSKGSDHAIALQWRLEWSRIPNVLIVKSPIGDTGKLSDTRYHLNNGEWKKLSTAEVNELGKDIDKIKPDEKIKARQEISAHVDGLIKKVEKEEKLDSENLAKPYSSKELREARERADFMYRNTEQDHSRKGPQNR